MDIYSNQCSGNIDHMACKELAQDPLTWIDGTSFEVVGLSGVERWEQIEPHRWRFFLRPGVKFHNGEPWNATAAKLGLDLNGDGAHGGGFSMHGFIGGEVVDDLTVDVVCRNDTGDTAACPIFPRTGLFTGFAAPEWYTNASQEERARTPMGFGPYRFLDWESGVKLTLEAYEDYVPNEAFAAQPARIQNVTQTWRSEALVRASMVATGEADWADNIGFENADRVPKALQSGTNEIYTLVPDTIWHTELRKKKVRMALAHAVNCQEIVQTLYDGRNQCYGNISQPGTLGITPENSAPYKYNPEMARRLLEEAKFDFDTEISIFTREGRVYRDLELQEAVVGYWGDIGVKGKVQVLENAQATAHRRSGCGQYGAESLNCASMPPAPPVNASTDYYETATSTEPLDYQRQNVLRLSCFNVNSRVCDPELEEKIRIANATPLGDLRRQRMEEIATIAHDEYYFLPFFYIQAIYGLAEDLEWTPRYDPRVRVSTMWFK
jgi:peptide/nickel transport system substrate-binding protein